SRTATQRARLDGAGVTVQRGGSDAFVRAIVPPPVIVPRERVIDFRLPIPGGLRDADGRGTGLTHRLPGTGSRLNERDANLRLDPDRGQLALTTTHHDLNHQVNT